MCRLSAFLCNVLWLLSALPSWLCFQLALWFPKRTQQRVLKRILKRNVKTEALNETPFHERRPRDYAEFRPWIERIMRGESNVLTRERPILLEPTGGSTAGPKLIPYTPALKREFQRAILPWIAGLFLKWPGLLLGRHYWCVTPATTEKLESVVPVGFESDASYLGFFQRGMARRIFAVPQSVARTPDAGEARFQTLLHLLRAPDLRLVSVWHPSFLTLLLETLEERFEELIGSLPPRRAREVRRIGCVPAKLWSRLQVISCWDGNACGPWIRQLREAFPSTRIQPKGLVATEGITSIPLGDREGVTAVRSHYFEFECLETGRLFPLWNLEKGKRYRLVLTTGGGLYRYQTHDRVEVQGFLHRTPRLRFISRDNVTSDLVGEKVSLGEAERILETLPGGIRFAMLAPEVIGTRAGYVLFVDADPVPEGLRRRVERGLEENFHYRHARGLGQIEPVRVCKVDDLAGKVRYHLARKGMREGALKLHVLRTETCWTRVLQPKALED